MPRITKTVVMAPAVAALTGAALAAEQAGADIDEQGADAEKLIASIPGRSAGGMTTDLGLRNGRGMIDTFDALGRMDPSVQTETAIPALIAEMAKRDKPDAVWLYLVDALAAIGPKAVPALTKALDRKFGEDVLAGKIGRAASGAVGRMLEQRPVWSWRSYYSLSHRLAARGDCLVLAVPCDMHW